MRIHRSRDPKWLSNTWLVADDTGQACLFDCGAPIEPITRLIEQEGLRLHDVFCTHHHHDHVAHAQDYRQRYGARILAHEKEAPLFAEGVLDDTFSGEVLEVGRLSIRPLLIPGHTVGQAAFVVDDAAVFTGDTLFKGSVGGTRAPGHTTFIDLRHSIMEVLLALPHDMIVYPGHMDETTLGAEWEANPFVRLWRGLETPGDGPCEALGREATLRLRAADYDGGTKCWVTFTDGVDDIVPGSRVRETTV